MAESTRPTSVGFTDCFLEQPQSLTVQINCKITAGSCETIDEPSADRIGRRGAASPTNYARNTRGVFSASEPGGGKRRARDQNGFQVGLAVNLR
jgi:hypothetical protein